MSEANLATADRIIEESQIKPEVNELDAIKQFCNFEVKRKQILEALSTQIKEHKKKVSFTKDKLEKLVGETECFALSKACCERLDAIAAKEGLEKVPRYCRILKANKDANITTETIEEALNGLTAEDIKEASEKSVDKNIKSVIKTLLMTNIRRIIRSYSHNLKLSKSIQRGNNLYDVSEASIEMADLMYDLHKIENEIKDLNNQKPSESADASIKDQVEKFFIRTGLTAQRIVVEGAPYKLVRKISIKKTKLGIGKIEKILDEILETTKTFNTSELMRSIQIHISEIPPETKSTVGLTALKVKD